MVDVAKAAVGAPRKANGPISVVGASRVAGELVTIDDVVFLQTLESGRFEYLSDLMPLDYRHVPYLSTQWPWTPDRNVAGGRLGAAVGM